MSGRQVGVVCTRVHTSSEYCKHANRVRVWGPWGRYAPILSDWCVMRIAMAPHTTTTMLAIAPTR